MDVNAVMLAVVDTQTLHNSPIVKDSLHGCYQPSQAWQHISHKNCHETTSGTHDKDTQEAAKVAAAGSQAVTLGRHTANFAQLHGANLKDNWNCACAPPELSRAGNRWHSL